MIYKNFRVSIFIRMIVIVGLAFALAFVFTRQPSLFVPAILIVALVIAVVDLVLYIEKSNRDLTHFLLSIRQGAFTESYTSGQKGKPFAELNEAMNEVIREFASLNAEKELQYQYLQALNENINVAILSFESDGKLVMMNPAARRLIHESSLRKFDDFKKIDPNLYERMRSIRPEERQVVRTFFQNEEYQIGIQLKEIILSGKHTRIFLLQNLSNELEAKELEAWHQLIRVLTHEIMNSVTPIVSLTGAVRNILTESTGARKDFTQLKKENIEDIFSGLDTIHSRSKGLLKFVSAYKEYARPVELKIESFDVVGLVDRILELLSPDLQVLKIQTDVNARSSSLVASGDKVLLEQVIINLIKNAMEAMPDDGAGKITIALDKKQNQNITIAIADNGPGMDSETLSRIFVPFFTTKAKGSGIGLSFSRQIMRLHNGNIKVHSAPGEGSVFTLEWPMA